MRAVKEAVREYLNRPSNAQIQAKVHAAASFIRSQPRPILVYQMAKVGSTSVCRALKAAGFHPLHVHFLTREYHRSVTDMYSDVGIKPTHYYLERLLRPYLTWTNHRLKVISLVRDPIARYVSGAFQWPMSRELGSDRAEEMSRMLAERLSRPEALEYEFTWFDRELKTTLDVDVLGNPFRRDEGYGLYDGPRAQVLVVKLERLSELLPTVVSDFVGAPLQNVRANVRRQKGKGDLYAEVKRTFQVPAPVCEAVYSHDWVHHFYTEAEIATFTRRWSAASENREVATA